MRWLVPGLCLLAIVVTLGTAAVRERGASEASDPEPDGDRGAELPRDTVAVAPLSARDEAAILAGCLEVPPGADPALSPDPDALEVVASGTTTGAAAIVWVGPTPQIERAVGVCVALERGDSWANVGHVQRRDLGPGTPILTWQPSASDAGVAASLAGRVRPATARVVVVLDDGRVLTQEVSDGFVALAWSPIREPVRLLAESATGEVIFDGTVSGYGS